MQRRFQIPGKSLKRPIPPAQQRPPHKGRPHRRFLGLNPDVEILRPLALNTPIIEQPGNFFMIPGHLLDGPIFLKSIEAGNTLIFIAFHPVGFRTRSLIEPQGEIDGQGFQSNPLPQQQLFFQLIGQNHVDGKGRLFLMAMPVITGNPCAQSFGQRLQFRKRPGLFNAGVQTPIDSAGPLDHANRIPMDIEIDEGCRILKVYTFGQDVAGKQHLDWFLNGICPCRRPGIDDPAIFFRICTVCRRRKRADPVKRCKGVHHAVSIFGIPRDNAGLFDQCLYVVGLDARCIQTGQNDPPVMVFKGTHRLQNGMNIGQGIAELGKEDDLLTLMPRLDKTGDKGSDFCIGNNSLTPGRRGRPIHIFAAEGKSFRPLVTLEPAENDIRQSGNNTQKQFKILKQVVFQTPKTIKMCFQL